MAGLEFEVWTGEDWVRGGRSKELERLPWKAAADPVTVVWR